MVASADMAGAYDVVHHDHLLAKLRRRCGLGEKALGILEQYLTGRTQRTCMSGGRHSAWREVPCGVPQGGVLSPLLFAIYTSDIGDYVTKAKNVQYADDVTLAV